VKAAVIAAFRRASRPLAWYYGIGVAVPVLNGATLDEVFFEHVTFVLAVPVVMVAASGCAWHLVRGRWRNDGRAV
jgi:hypothetical protein